MKFQFRNRNLTFVFIALSFLFIFTADTFRNETKQKQDGNETRRSIQTYILQ